MERLDMTINSGAVARRNVLKKKRVQKRISIKAKIAVVICSIGLLFSLVLYLTRIEKVEVETGKHYSSEEIKNMVIDDFWTKNSLFLYSKYRYQKQESIPFIEYIDVEMVSRNKVKIVVYDKDIIGCIEYMDNIVYFDKDGYFVETSHEKQGDVPKVSGVNFSEITLHDKMKVENKDLFDIIMNLTQQISRYELDIDEICFDYTYDISLYSGDIEVMLGNGSNYYDKLAQLKNMLEEAKKQKLKGVLHMENYNESQKNVVFDQKK